MENICPNCQTITQLDICPNCDLILVGENRGKDKRDVELETKSSKKKED